MASRYLALDIGKFDPQFVASSSSTNSKAVELVIDLTKTTDKLQVLQCVRGLLAYLSTYQTGPIT